MILDSLRLENIRSYEEETISFPSGTTLFEGDIGSGKSTILMAIEFALFGLGDQKGASLLRMGAKRGSATLVFEVDGEKYEVYRSLERKPRTVQQGEGYLKSSRGKEHLAAGELKERILEVLQFKEPSDPKAQSVIYRYAVFTPQEAMKAILVLDPTNRLQTLRKAFGIEDYKIAAEHALSLSRKIEGRAKVLEGQISDLEDKKAELERKNRSLEEHRERLGKLATDEKRLGKTLDEQKKKRDSLLEKEKGLKKIEGEVPQLEKQVKDKRALAERLERESRKLREEADSEIIPEIKKLKQVQKPTKKGEDTLRAEIKKLRGLEKEQTQLEASISALKKDVEKLEKKVGDYKDVTVEGLEARIKAIEKQIKDITKDVESNEKTLEGVIEKKHITETRISEINKNLEDLEGLGGICPICNRTLTEEHKKKLEKERREAISKLKVELSSQKKSVEELRGKIDTGRKKAEKLSAEAEKLDRIKESLAELVDKDGQLATNRKTLGELASKMRVEEEEGFPGIAKFRTPVEYSEALLEKLKEYNSAQDRLGEMEKRLEKNQNTIKGNLKSIEALTADTAELAERLGKAWEALKELENVSTKIAEFTESTEKMEEKLRELRDYISSTKTLIETLSKDVQELGEVVKKKEEQKDIRKKLMEYCQWLRDYFVLTLDSIEKHVMVNINLDFNQHFQRWFNLLVEDASKDARVDEDFTPLVEQDGYEQDVDFLSGGEKTSVALAYRLALNNIVQRVSTGMKSNLLVLDEPTDGFSKEQLFKVREILRELQCPQVVLVSHEKELESFADNVFRIVKSDGRSSIIG